jgi:sulfite oxidase
MMMFRKISSTFLRQHARHAPPSILSTFSVRQLQQKSSPPPPPPNATTFSTKAAAAFGLSALGLATYVTNGTNSDQSTSSLSGLSTSFCASSNNSKEKEFYTRAEVAKHNSAETGIWVTFEDGIYDITNFVEEHPGGVKRIMLAAGGRVDPFWKLYQQHFTDKVQDILKGLRIGTLHPDEEVIIDESDPYSMEPERHPALLVRCLQPFNAESPKSLMSESYLTPNTLWYCRHHHPVPVVDPETFQLDVKSQIHLSKDGEMTFNNIKSLSLKDIQTKYKKYEVVATMQCGGNRRDDLNKAGKAQGLCWDIGAISTAKWGGARLRDVLADVAGIHTLEDAEKMNVKHVHFLPLDPPYDSSIPIEKALHEYGDVLLAYEMNGETLPREHGYPIRIIVPGTIGARNVKWVNSIRLSSEEAESTWQRGVQYKGFSPNIKKFDNSINPMETLSVQEMPVQSAVTLYEDEIEEGDTEMDISGYAWSGGGKSIVRVDITTDGGKTWSTADLGEGKDQRAGRAWGWTLWTATIKIPSGTKAGDTFQIACKAVDSSYNQQPEKIETVWNLRGILNNSWHKVNVKCVEQ